MMPQTSSEPAKLWFVQTLSSFAARLTLLAMTTNMGAFASQ